MRLSLEQLIRFWDSAAEPIPLIIVGAGRWGRTLTLVAAEARGGTKNLVLVARQNNKATTEWAMPNPLLRELVVARDAAAAAACLGTAHSRAVAVVASRPSQHATDVRECLELGFDTLVEKPLVARPEDGLPLLELARDRGRLLGLGVVLSLTPALHHAAGLADAPFSDVELEWADPPNELRHGQVKRVHPEIHLLEDILPHAVSVFRIYATAPSNFALAAVEADEGSERGSVHLSERDASYRFTAVRDAPRRIRTLRARSGAAELKVDFAAGVPRTSLDGRTVPLPDEWACLASPLRLELGAMFECTRSRSVATPLTQNLAEFVQLHAALRWRLEAQDK